MLPGGSTDEQSRKTSQVNWVDFRSSEHQEQPQGLGTFLILFLFYVYGCFACGMSVDHMHAWYPWRPEEGAGSPGG